MAKYHQCPNCGNTAKRTNVYQCGKCGRVFCATCGKMTKGDWLFLGVMKAMGTGGDKCPFCGAEGFFKVRHLGSIE